jgi:transposase-like protein
LFPLAYAVVNAENDDNWLWFIRQLHQIIEAHAATYLVPGVLTILSDRQKGLIEGVETVFPHSPHGYCLRHLWDNMHKEFKNKNLREHLWKAARALTINDFNNALKEMENIDKRSVRWLLKTAPAKYWAELYFPGCRYGHLTSNIAESLNSWILEARDMPILGMFEKIRHQLMQRYVS